MRKVIIPVFTLCAWFLNSCSCRKCPQQPTYNLCSEQLVWFRPENEKWLFLKNENDTVSATTGAVNRSHYDSGAGYTLIRSKCSPIGPMVEKGSQEIFLDRNLYFSILADVTSEGECRSIYYGRYYDKKEKINNLTVNGIIYTSVVKEYMNINSSTEFDTVYYNQDKGLIKLVVGKQFVLTRLPS